MGARGPAKKSAARSQRKRPRTSPETQARVLALVRPARVPPMPASRFRSGKPLKVTRDQWGAFWRSELAGLVQPGDTPALVRLFTLYDERERAWDGYTRNRVVEGSTGQMVLNPLAKAVRQFDSEIRNLEDRFGLTPMARMRLGITVGQAKRSLDDLNRELDADRDEEPAEDEEDPRLSGSTVELAPRDR